MFSTWWAGVLLGLLIVGASSLVRAVTHIHALRASTVSGSLHATVYGILLRGAVILGALALVLGLAPVHKVAVSVTVLVGLVLSIVSEVATIWKTALGNETPS